MSHRSVNRIRLLAGCIFCCALILVGKLYMTQIVHGETFSERADRQYLRPDYRLFNRGSLFFQGKNGTVIAAATQRSGFTVAINPTLLKNPEEAYEKLSSLLTLDKDVFLQRASKKDDPYEEVANAIVPEIAAKVEALAIPGVNIYTEKWRYYPGRSLAAHALGLVGFQGDERAGRYGLERFYDDVLRRDNETLYVNFFAELFAGINTVFTPAREAAGDVVLTLEPTVEAFLEEQLLGVKNEWHARSAAGIIINPQTGEIYAMGIVPHFDPNDFSEEKNVAVFSNPLVENVFEMGSIIKPLTMAAGLAAGAITSGTTYYDSGSLTLDTETFSNYDGKGRGKVDMQEVLNKSLNTGAAFVVKQMGNQAFARAMFAYGLGEKTGIDLPNETYGLLDNLKSPRDIEYATASFGQGIALTPIATVRALSTLGNGGMLITPHFGKEVRRASGLHTPLIYPAPKQIFPKQTSEEITRMLVKVVDTALLDGSVKLEHYSIAAKTGTAQIPNQEEGGYYSDRYLHSFFGYFPAYNPQFLVFLYAQEPQGVRYASQTLTQPFMNITKFLLNYYEVPPDR